MVLKNIHTGSKTKKNVHKDGVERLRKAIGDEKFEKIENWMLEHFEHQEWVNTTFIAPENGAILRYKKYGILIGQFRIKMNATGNLQSSMAASSIHCFMRGRKLICSIVTKGSTRMKLLPTV